MARTEIDFGGPIKDVVPEVEVESVAEEVVDPIPIPEDQLPEGYCNFLVGDKYYALNIAELNIMEMDPSYLPQNGEDASVEFDSERLFVKEFSGDSSNDIIYALLDGVFVETMYTLTHIMGLASIYGGIEGEEADEEDFGDLGEREPEFDPNEILVMNFGGAIQMLKEGYRLARKQWGEANVFIYLVPAGSFDAYTAAGASIAGESGKVNYNPYIAIKWGDNTVSMYTPNNEDILAEDWIIIPYTE